MPVTSVVKKSLKKVKLKDVPSDPSPAPLTLVSGELLAAPVPFLKCCCTLFGVLLRWVSALFWKDISQGI